MREFAPFFLTTTRAAIAGLVGIFMIVLLRQRWPARSQIGSLILVAIGCVVGFPIFTALALQTITSARATIFIGLLPISTALFGAMRDGDSPRTAFWLFSTAGAIVVATFALSQDDGNLQGDGFMVAACIICGLGYAEGARLSRDLGGWQVISFAHFLALPIILPLAILRRPTDLGQFSLPSIAGLAYISLFSSLIGFVFWYRGLAQGGIAAVGQLQLLQPFLSLALAALLLHEAISPAVWIVAICVVACVAGAKRFA